MNNWGVRLIALLFIIGAISNVYGLSSGAFQVNGLLGFEITYGDKPSGVMAWVGALVFVYTGIQFLRFQPSGRDWALFFGSGQVTSDRL